ncbi:MAG TPA: hypothetical protein VHU80_25385 [Polyangiaceae bacterium]|nr:hypothetical protein [Polyangiaceae bacterium]
MTPDHLTAIIKAAEARKDDKGWWATQEGRHVTLYAASGGSSLTVSRIEALRVDGPLLAARTVRGEEYLLTLEDVFAGAVEPQAQGGRRAGFG